TLYILIYYKDRIFKKLINIVFVVVPYFLIIVLVSSILQKINITENPLWRGSEPKITNVLKGTNFNSLGMWNVEDAKLVEENINNYDELKLKCKEVIHDRFTTAPILKVLIFYLGKLGAQWCIGDFAGSLWTQKDVPKEKIIFKIGIFGSAPFQIFYIIILIFIFLGLKKRSVINSNSQLNLFYLIFLGYIAAYLITENQNRYGYIISWLFIILAVDGIKEGFLFKAKDE
ncbi:dolichyl-phosphate-mannose--protein mannosyltransferase, partial [Clostridium botulinum]|nr:dolichyl-phosphate-mannose--protein mannosyltransferase [Clostridium botulinum]